MERYEADVPPEPLPKALRLIEAGAQRRSAHEAVQLLREKKIPTGLPDKVLRTAMGAYFLETRIWPSIALRCKQEINGSALHYSLISLQTSIPSAPEAALHTCNENVMLLLKKEAWEGIQAGFKHLWSDATPEPHISSFDTNLYQQYRGLVFARAAKRNECNHLHPDLLMRAGINTGISFLWTLPTLLSLQLATQKQHPTTREEFIRLRHENLRSIAALASTHQDVLIGIVKETQIEDGYASSHVPLTNGVMSLTRSFLQTLIASAPIQQHAYPAGAGEGERSIVGCPLLYARDSRTGRPLLDAIAEDWIFPLQDAYLIDPLLRRACRGSEGIAGSES